MSKPIRLTAILKQLTLPLSPGKATMCGTNPFWICGDP